MRDEYLQFLRTADFKTDDAAFQQAITDALAVFGWTARELSNLLGHSTSTVERWAAGLNLRPPSLRRPIIAKLLARGAYEQNKQR